MTPKLQELQVDSPIDYTIDIQVQDCSAMATTRQLGWGDMYAGFI